MTDTWTGSVDAKLEAGQQTGFTVNKGDVITIVASGWAERGPGKVFGPQGDEEYKPTGLLCPAALVGALIMKIGDQVYPVNSGLFRWEVPVPGEVIFLYNDVPGNYDNNGGSFHVSVGRDKSVAPIQLWSGSVPAAAEQGVTTGVVLKKGDVISITASGQAAYNDNKPWHGPDGDKSWTTQIATIKPDATVGALVMKIGANIVAVGSKLSSWSSEHDGEIVLFYNDMPGTYGDNHGSYAVAIAKM